MVAATHVAPEIGLWKAHNLVEMSFEMALGQRYPHLGRGVAAACADGNLIARVTAPLAIFYGQPANALAANIINFPATVALDDPTSTNLARAYSAQLQFKHGVTDADIPAMARIIDDIWVAIVSDRAKFLARCVRRVEAVLTI